MAKQQTDSIVIQALILAAGSSSRLGEPKQLLEINGRPLLSLIIGEVIKLGLFEISIVLGAFSDKITETIDLSHLRIIHNSDWEKGIGSSIKAGLNSILDCKPEGVMILSCDQPLINSAYLKQMYGHFEHSNYGIIASAYAGTFGIPALFRKKYFDDIMNIDDKSGCRGIILQNIEDTCNLGFPEGEFDIDTPEDLTKIRQLI